MKGENNDGYLWNRPVGIFRGGSRTPAHCRKEGRVYLSECMWEDAITNKAMISFNALSNEYRPAKTSGNSQIVIIPGQTSHSGTQDCQKQCYSVTIVLRVTLHKSGNCQVDSGKWAVHATEMIGSGATTELLGSVTANEGTIFHARCYARTYHDLVPCRASCG